MENVPKDLPMDILMTQVTIYPKSNMINVYGLEVLKVIVWLFLDLVTFMVKKEMPVWLKLLFQDVFYVKKVTI